MKLLWLGTSQDVDGYVPEERRAPGLVGKRLGEIMNTDVEVDVRYIWPTKRLPSLLESWMEQSQPDMVLIVVSAYWCCYESVPLKVQRKFGKAGGRTAKAGLKVADTGWLSSNRLFYAAKRLALLTIGGATNFEPEKVLTRMKECISIVRRNEDTVLLIHGLHALDAHYTLAGRRPWAEARRQFVDRGLSDFCRDLPVSYDGIETEPDFYSDLSLRYGDRLHYTPAGQAAVVGDYVPRFLEAWKQRHPELPDLPVDG